jgi:hypothetical protein
LKEVENYRKDSHFSSLILGRIESSADHTLARC